MDCRNFSELTANPQVERGLLEAQVKKMAGPLRLTTVTHRVAVLSTAHQIKGFESPCKRDAVKLVLKQARRAVAKRDERPRQKTAITRTELMAMLATCDDSLEGIRDRALLHFGFGSGGRRRSEIAAADMRDLRRVEPSRYLYRLTHSKTRQNGGSPNDNKDKPINGVNAEALTRWLEASGITEGRIFRRVRKSVLGAPLSPKAVAEIVRRRALKAGLVGDFAGHSLRSGFVTEAGRRGIHLRQVMAMTDHKSVASVLGYFQTGEAAANPAASILDDE